LKNLSFLATLGWSIVSLFGFFIAKWDIGQTVLFINLGFFSLAFNYYAVISILSFKEFFIDAVKKEKREGGLIVLLLPLQVVQFLFNQLLLLLGLLVCLVLTLGFLTTYLYIVFGIKELDDFAEIWDEDWTRVLVIAIVLLLIELAIFLRQYVKLDPFRSPGWKSLKPFAVNSLLKFKYFIYGSVFVLVVDSLLNSENTFGYLSLAWLYALNLVWAYIDLTHPPALSSTFHKVDENP
jgi:hypothetical protein